MVQKRLDMTAEERRERPPYDDYDVAPYMQVVHGENGAALSAEPEDMASKLEGTAANKVRTPTKSQSVELLAHHRRLEGGARYDRDAGALRAVGDGSIDWGPEQPAAEDVALQATEELARSISWPRWRGAL